GKIVSSLVGDVLMPIIGLILGGINVSGLSIGIGDAVIKYGAFLQSVIDFLIIAFSIFLLIKGINKLRKKPVEAPKEPTTKICPYCFTEIPIKATRCPNCTSQLN
ncbi:MAG: large conductance mechanosensitive channel protein MscL, partial [Caldisericia bacterium]|nr:large conductance mechanosensitive channel protein MscL [Caldisericia bacterium]